MACFQDQQVLADFTQGHGKGGCLLRHGIDTSTFGVAAWNIIGAAAADFRSPIPSTFNAFGRSWTMGSFLGAGSVHVQLGVTEPQVPSWGSAQQLAVDQRGIGALYLNRLNGTRSGADNASNLRNPGNARDTSSYAPTASATRDGGTAVTATPAVDHSLGREDLAEWYFYALQLCR